jgi:hypothetical protein
MIITRVAVEIICHGTHRSVEFSNQGVLGGLIHLSRICTVSDTGNDERICGSTWVDRELNRRISISVKAPENIFVCSPSTLPAVVSELSFETPVTPQSPSPKIKPYESIFQFQDDIAVSHLMRVKSWSVHLVGRSGRSSNEHSFKMIL